MRRDPSETATKQLLGFVLQDVARLMRRNFNRRAQKLGLTEAHWRVLTNVSRCPGIRQAQLAELLEMHPISVARQIDRMEASGWVRREKDPDDRRAINLYLTDQVEPMIKGLYEQGKQVREHALQGLTEEQRQTLSDALLLMRRNLSDEI